jgi:type II secretory pathway pseudopilin PulG
MKIRGMALVEIVVSMIILAVSALAVTSTVSMVNSKQMRSAGGSSLDLQALSYARETLESLKNAVNASDYAANTGALQSSDPDPTIHTAPLPSGDLLNHGGTRQYKVWNVPGTGGQLKKVTVEVAWTD